MILKRLFENTDHIKEEDLANIIKTQAQPFLKSSGGYLAYSGRRKTVPWFKGQYRTDRKPLDTNPILNDIINKHLEEKGLNLRSNSIFITSRIGRAISYGNPYVIFPLGEIKYHWYKHINDLTMYLEDYENINSIYKLFSYYYENGLVSYEQIEKNFLNYVIKLKRDKFFDLIKDKDYTPDQKLQIISDILHEGYSSGIPLYNDKIKDDLLAGFPKVAPYDYIWETHSDQIDIVSDKPLSDVFKVSVGEVVINSTNGYLAILPKTFLLEVLPKMPNTFILDHEIMNMLSRIRIQLLDKLVPDFDDKLLDMYKKWIDDMKSDSIDQIPEKEHYIKILYDSCIPHIKDDKLKSEYSGTQYMEDIDNLNIFLNDNQDVLNYIKENVSKLLDVNIHRKVFSKIWDINL